MSVITVSRQLASLGCDLAAQVAGLLGFRLVDREIIHRAAEEAGVPKIALQEIAYEGRIDVVNRILQAVYAMPPVATPCRGLEAGSRLVAGPALWRHLLPGAAILCRDAEGLR